MLRRYSAEFFQLPAEDGVALLEYAINAEWEHNVFLRWIAGNEFGMSFDAFKEEVKPRPLRSTRETMKDVKDILDNTAWKKSS